MLSTVPLKATRIHVEIYRGGLADLDAGEIGLLEVGIDPPAIGFDDGEERLSGLDGRARPEVTFERMPSEGAVAWVFTRSWVALASWAEAALSCTVGVVTVSGLSCSAAKAASASL